ncbi:MAG: hypothetical protein KDJ52_26800, partial [Anaerolineae bacterium]|nr:hypothetical protein [Anaerolineae bacterium]
MNRNTHYNRKTKSITHLLTFNTGLLLITLALFSLVPVAQAQSPVARVSIAHVEAKAQPSGQVDISAFVSVTNEAGQPISGLTAGDFILTENDQRIKTQSLSVTPATNALTAVLLVDAGARMADVGPDRVRTIDAAKDASVRFIESL